MKIRIAKAVRLIPIVGGKVEEIGKQERVEVTPGIYEMKTIPNPNETAYAEWSVVLLANGDQAGLAKEAFNRKVDFVILPTQPDSTQFTPMESMSMRA